MSQTFTVFPLPQGLAGQIVDSLDSDCLSIVSADTLDMPFGVMVAKGNSDVNGILPNGSGIIPIGVLALSFVYDNGPNGSLSAVGLRPQAMMNVMRRGRIWVLVEENVTAYDRAFIRFTAGAGGTQLGAFRKSADSASALDVTKKCQYLTSATAGNLAVLDVDMLNS